MFVFVVVVPVVIFVPDVVVVAFSFTLFRDATLGCFNAASFVPATFYPTTVVLRTVQASHRLP